MKLTKLVMAIVCMGMLAENSSAAEDATFEGFFIEGSLGSGNSSPDSIAIDNFYWHFKDFRPMMGSLAVLYRINIWNNFYIGAGVGVSMCTKIKRQYNIDDIDVGSSTKVANMYKTLGIAYEKESDLPVGMGALSITTKHAKIVPEAYASIGYSICKRFLIEAIAGVTRTGVSVDGTLKIEISPTKEKNLKAGFKLKNTVPMFGVKLSCAITQNLTAEIMAKYACNVKEGLYRIRKNGAILAGVTYRFL